MMQSHMASSTRPAATASSRAAAAAAGGRPAAAITAASRAVRPTTIASRSASRGARPVSATAAARGARPASATGATAVTAARAPGLYVAPSAEALVGRTRLILDTADVKQWERWLATGAFYGLTTNPAILEKDGVPCTLGALRQLAAAARRLGARELQLQAWGATPRELLSRALRLAALAPDLVVIKLPCTESGLATAAALRAQGVRVTITAIYASQQMLLAQAVGAEYAAPYLGRMESALGAGKGFAEVARMARIAAATGSSTRVLVASIRSAADLATLSAEGCDTFTFSPAIAAQLFCLEATEKAAAEFEAAAARNAGKKAAASG